MRKQLWQARDSTNDRAGTLSFWWLSGLTLAPMTSSAPVFRDLEFREIEAMLKEHTYGRLAFTFRDRVDIEPIHYVYDDGWLVCRTGAGTKLTQLAHHPWVAFEIDEVRGLYEWRSVVIKGTVYLVEPDGSPEAGEKWSSTVAVLRRLMPSALTPSDPVPHRNVIFRIHIDEMHGRAAVQPEPAPNA